MNEIQLWICSYIENVDLEFNNLSQKMKLDCDIFEATNLDSLGVMNLLLGAEEKFVFSFSAENFQDRRLRTVSGLASLIAEIVAAK